MLSVAWVVTGCLALAGAATAEITVPGDRATLRWNPASGPVAGYMVLVARNDASPRAENMVSTAEVTLIAAPGDRIRVSVVAHGVSGGKTVYGPPSAYSDSIVFGGSSVPPPNALAILDCASCRATEFRAVPSNASILTLAHPPTGAWDLIRFADFAGAGMLQGLLRERTTGMLWFGDLTAKGLVPRTSHLETGFDRAWPARSADFDGDGVHEVVIRDYATGRTEIWGLVNGALTRRASFNTWSKWSLIGARDLDGDAIADLWFDDTLGNAMVVRTRDLAFSSLVTIQTGLTGRVALDVADYDGDQLPDVLWRGPTGDLTLSLLRGDRVAPQVENRALPALAGDSQLLHSGSAEFDGSPGDEIFVQNVTTGAVDVILPRSANPGLRQRLMTAAPGWRLIQIAK